MPSERALTREDFGAMTGANADVLHRLAAYLDLLRRWQKRINLVGPSTLRDPWRRHFLDSAQLAPLLPTGRPALIDLGSGAGFPGLVLAAMTPARVDLIESDGRKCAFLAEAARVMGVQVAIHAVRAESIKGQTFDVMTARAFGPLPELLAYAHGLLAENGRALLLRGRSWRSELTAAERSWTMRVTPVQSRSDPAGMILRFDKLFRRHDA